MSQAARAIVDELLGVFVAAFRPIVEERFRHRYGPDWRKKRGLQSTSGIGQSIRSLDDPSELLGQVLDALTWSDVFEPILKDRPQAHQIRSTGRDLRGIRHKLAHYREVVPRDALIAAGDARRFLSAFGALSSDDERHLEAQERAAAALIAGDRGPELERARHEYLDSLSSDTSYLDTVGISPAAASTVVRLRLDAAYIPREFLPFQVRPRANPSDVDDTLVAETSTAEGSRLDMHDVLALNRAVIVGGPGIGKTSLLRRIARDAALGSAGSMSTRTPILVRVARFSRALASDPMLTLRNYVRQLHTDRFGELFGIEMEEGRALVLLDGLDEVADDRERHAAAAAIAQFAADHPSCAMFVKSRPIGYRSMPLGTVFTAVAIAPLSDDQVREFIHRWRAAAGGDATEEDEKASADSLSAEIEATQDLVDLARNPLLLTILMLIAERGGKLPAKRAEILQAATDTLLRDWPYLKFGVPFDESLALALLEPIAHAFVGGDPDVLTEHVLVERLALGLEHQRGVGKIAAREEAKRFLVMVEAQVGLLAEVGFEGGERRYSFLHRAFAEYLAARQMAGKWRDGQLDLKPYVHQAAWAGTVTLFFEHIATRGIPAASRAIRELVDLDWPLERHLLGNLRLALALLVRGVAVEPELREELLSRAISAAVHPAFEFVRASLQYLVVALAEQHSSRQAEGLVDLAMADDRATETRKTLLRFLLPGGDAHALGGALEAIDEIRSAAGSWELDEIDVLLRAGAKAGIDPDDSLIIVAESDWVTLDSEAAGPFHEAGLPEVAITDLARELDPAAVPSSSIWLLDVSAASTLTPVGHVRLWTIPAIRELLPRLQLGEGWHDAHANEIQALISEGPIFSASLAELAWEFVLNLEGDAGQPWWQLLLALAQHGASDARARATRFLWLAEDDDEYGQVVEHLVTTLPGAEWRVRLAVALALVETLNPPDELFDVVRDLAAHDPDQGVRSLAKRALLARSDSPFALLADPETFFPVEIDLVEGPWALGITGELVQAVARLDRASPGKEEIGAIERAFGRILASAPYPPDHWELSPGGVFFGGSADKAPHVSRYPIADRVARDLVTSERPETRAWAAALLPPNRVAAIGELRKLMSDPDGRVRAAAAAAISPVDVADVRWLSSVLPDLIERGPLDAITSLGDRLRTSATQTGRDELAETLAVVFEEWPGNQNALALACILLL